MLIHGIDAYGAGTGMFEKREVGMTYLCTSLISEKHLKRANATRYYGFRNIGSNALIEEGCQDIYSQANGDNSLEVTAGQDMKFLLPEKLLDLSDSYNEVVLWREYLGDNGQMQELKPDYLVCFNTIAQGDREEAKRLDIPIVLIDEKAYSKGEKEYGNDIVENIEQNHVSFGNSLISILEKAKDNCSASSQHEVMEKIVEEIRKKEKDYTKCR